eukprot:CAMPEP_0170302964 /NCGR_PEP_ID=MMETSP0116_2-20130129/51786_1 /TAXON_ID=400756 /ORGANISM="Durinskia baltica, Strain CSIRO CS-38" /LENGTH=323 /DNA_ID=CAMNT_0010554875 /DNA_START=1 /DNA_END=969 /DNA_ORIENTATION=+
MTPLPLAPGLPQILQQQNEALRRNEEDSQRFLAVAARLRQRFPDTVVDSILIHSARFRYEVAAHIFGEEGELHAAAWSVYSWPDRRNHTHYIASAPRGIGGPVTAAFCLLSANSSPHGRSMELELQCAQRGDDLQAFLFMAPTDEGRPDFAPLVFLTCRGMNHHLLAYEWNMENCAEGLGTQWNATPSEVMMQGRCASVADYCEAIWSVSSAATDTMPCWNEVMDTLAAVMSPDDGTVVMHSATESFDFVWPFRQEQLPRMLQDAPANCPEPPEFNIAVFRAISEPAADFSPDGVLYATGNATHVQVFETADAGRLVLELAVA